MPLGGLSVPIPTLFTDSGALDLSRNTRFARELSEAKVDHLFVLGSLGEFPSITDVERGKLIDIVVDSVTGKTDVWVGVGAPSTAQAVAYAESAEAAGAEALVAVAPYYLHPTPAAIDRYYRAIHAATGIPLFAYNIPSLVGYPLSPELIHRLGGDGVIVGVKDTAASIASVEGFLRNRPPDFAIMPGDDTLASSAILAGATGAVMGMANLAPRLCVELIQAAREGNAARAAELQSTVDALVAVSRAGPFPSTDKFLAARLRGAEVGYRAPYDPLSTDEEEAVLAALAPVEERLRPFLGK
jgi:4-hydroxy-tetrahydrodipicolinate synthase